MAWRDDHREGGGVCEESADAAALLEGVKHSEFQAERLVRLSTRRRGVEELDSGERVGV